MNKAIMMGRLTGDPETRVTQSGVSIARFNIAVDKKIKREGQPTADFFSCQAFGKTAEFIQKYLAKGTKVVLSGRVENDNYTDKNGNKVYGTIISIEEIDFAESKGGDKAEKNNTTETDGFMNIPDSLEEELPFA